MFQNMAEEIKQKFAEIQKAKNKNKEIEVDEFEWIKVRTFDDKIISFWKCFPFQLNQDLARSREGDWTARKGETGSRLEVDWR